MVEDKNTDNCVLGGKVLSNPPPGDEIVISGVSSAFPSAMNAHEIRDKLFNKVDMVAVGHRWDYKHPELPTSTGLLPEIDKYDAGFFGLHERQSHSLDTMGRLLQEKAVEAIFDAGLHPADLAGTRTGVFVGACFSESDKSWFFDNLTPHTYAFTG
ncbi:hypothetical protein NQ318_004675 [Aromia moschata]|uniref:Beta-ketoacyl synthase-like N-terminal domain-containing protein n=1 Tax=Aromia moschata TaxID=1265417 RepID=A0AAV8Y745_9CUCU|nr:hypothetical protein NQ318_004675 [Aromia moschata]